MSNSSPLLFFLHAPKTGGKTIEVNFRTKFGSKVLRVSKTFPEISVNDVAGYAAAFEKNRDLAKDARVVTGHYCYGLHAALGAAPCYFSIIRDPVKRLKSYYNYVLNSDSYFIRDFIVDNNISFRDLAHFGDDYMVAGYPKEFDIMVENGQVRLLAGMTGTLAQPVDEAVYAKALEHVKSDFLFIAPTECVNEAMVAAYRHLGTRPSIRYQRINVAAKDHVGRIPDDLDAYIRQRNTFDLRLLDVANQSFAEYIAPIAGRIRLSVKMLEAFGYGYQLAKKAGL